MLKRSNGHEKLPRTKFGAQSISKSFSLRIAGVATAAVLAVMIVALDPVLGPTPSAGGWIGGNTPPVSVDRALKGDRLPLANIASPALQPAAPPQSETRAQIPVGCEPLFSPIFSAPHGNAYRRCLT